jgi:hypothetical protein
LYDTDHHERLTLVGIAMTIPRQGVIEPVIATNHQEHISQLTFFCGLMLVRREKITIEQLTNFPMGSKARMLVDVLVRSTEEDPIE